jgi:hypothetical protein
VTMGAMLGWPVVAVLGFLLMTGLVVALATSSTARYEFERNGARDKQRSDTQVSTAHPAGSRAPARPTGAAEVKPVAQAVAVRPAPAPAGGPAWWLVDEWTHVVAGPFADRVDADWAALSAGLSESAQSVHGVQRADGGIVRRQSPEEKAWLAELGDQLDRLPEDWDELLSDDDVLTTLVVEVAAALVEAGLPVHDCVGSEAAGGVCLTPGPHYGGVVVSWHQHDRMSAHHVRGQSMTATVQDTMNATVAGLLTAMGFEVEPFGEGRSLVTDICGRG